MSVENTWLETAWEDRTTPVQTKETRKTGFFSYCSLAQSVEHAAVNRGVVSSSLTGAAMIADEKAARQKSHEKQYVFRGFFAVLAAKTSIDAKLSKDNILWLFFVIYQKNRI